MPYARDKDACAQWRLGKRVSTVLVRMMKGETLHAHLSHADGITYWLEPSGKSVGPQTAGRVIGLPCVKPDNDTLFDTVSQTYRYVGKVDYDAMIKDFQKKFPKTRARLAGAK